MRPSALVSIVVVCTVGCAQPGPSRAPETPSPATATGSGRIDASRIDRVRAELPPGYEVAGADGVPVPTGLWGFPAGSAADPAQCLGLIDPADAVVDPAAARGFSGSGAGGIVYVVVAPGTGAFEPALPTECGRWTLAGAHSWADVTLTESPAIADAVTVGVSAVIRTVVESGTETDSAAHTFVAYLADHRVFVTLVTDPGSTSPPLAPDFAADLLARTVSVLRGESGS